MNSFAEMAAQAPRDADAWMEHFETLRERTAMGPLGVELTAIDDDHAVMEFEITDAARQPMGLLHGGVSLMIAESVASMHAAWVADLSVTAPVGVDINGTHLRSATEGRVRATARVLRLTRAFVFHEVDVTLVEDDRVLCKVRITNYFRPHDRS